MNREELPPEEFVFFARMRDWLLPEYHELWVADEHCKLALLHEHNREKFKRGLTDEEYGIGGNALKVLMNTPFVRLSDDHVRVIRDCTSLDRTPIYLGPRGTTFIAEPMKEAVSRCQRHGDKSWQPGDNDWRFFFNWSASDEALKQSFAKFVESNRPKNLPNPSHRGRQSSPRDQLKSLAATRLRKAYSGQRAIERASEVMREDVPAGAFFSDQPGLIRGAKPAEELFSYWQKIYGLEMEESDSYGEQ